jgi:hypothetical protein
MSINFFLVVVLWENINSFWCLSDAIEHYEINHAVRPISFQLHRWHFLEVRPLQGPISSKWSIPRVTYLCFPACLHCLELRPYLQFDTDAVQQSTLPWL